MAMALDALAQSAPAAAVGGSLFDKLAQVKEKTVAPRRTASHTVSFVRPTSVYVLQNVRSGAFLAAKLDSAFNGTAVVQTFNLEDPAAHWKFVRQADGCYAVAQAPDEKFGPGFHPKCLNLEGGAVADGTRVQLWSNPEAAESQWLIELPAYGKGAGYNAGTFRLRSKKADLHLAVPKHGAPASGGGGVEDVEVVISDDADDDEDTESLWRTIERPSKSSA
eukprot:SAG22_NODE_4601_length_1220_cov_1.264050_1_plen_220_part_01